MCKNVKKCLKSLILLPASSEPQVNAAAAAEAAKHREGDLRRVQQHMEKYGTSCSYYGRSFRNPLTDRYYIKS